MKTLYVGVDVSKNSNVVYLMLQNGNKCSNFKVPNTHLGAFSMVKRIHSTLVSHSLEKVVLGLESTSVYGSGLVNFFKKDDTLKDFKKEIHVLQPRQGKRFHDSYNNLPKNDYVDSFVIADCLRFGRIKNEIFLGDDRFEALQNLTRARFTAVEDLVVLKQRFLNVLFKKFSTFAQAKIFSDRFGATAMAVWEKYGSAEELANMDLQELTTFISKKSRNRISDPNAVAKAIQRAALSSYKLPKIVNDSVNQVLAISIADIRAKESQIKMYDEAIADQMKSMPSVLKTIPGIGQVLSAGILAEIRDIRRFDCEEKIAKLAGLVWQQHQSGNFEAEYTRLIQSGNRFLKYYLIEAAFCLVGCNGEYERYYNLKKQEVNRGGHKRALALTARKFVRLVFRLLKDNRSYIER